MAILTCSHHAEPFNYDPFGPPYVPTMDEIRKYKLWQCSNCGLWYSFIGVTET